MGSISAGDLTLLRDRATSQQSVEKLYIWGFPQMWTGLVNDLSIARGDQTIAYDTGVLQGSFAFADITEGLMVWFGSTAGSDDLGRRMLLSITGTAASGSMIIDWYDDMELSDGDFITIIHLRPPWPKFSWFSTADGFYKFGPPASQGGAGIIYSDQNEDPPPHVVIGRCVAVDGVAVSYTVDASSSQAVATGATLSTYAWSVTPSGTAATFANSALATTTFTPVDGTQYYIACTVTDSNGKSNTGYRAFYADDPTNSTAITEFSRSAITESYNDFDVGCTITLTSPAGNQVTWADIDAETMVIIVSSDSYGATDKTITFRDETRYTDRTQVLYCGYVISEKRTSQENGRATIEIRCVTATGLFLYSLSLTGVRTPTDWFEMSDDLMYVAALLFHLLKFHSTLLEVSDWIFDWTDQTLRSAVEEWTEGTLIDRARSLAGPHGRLMAITATSQGEYFVEQDSNLLSAADRAALTTTLTLDNDDVTDVWQVDINHIPTLSQVYASGGVSQGVLGTFIPYLSISQEVRKAKGTRTERFERLMIPTQAEVNRLTGRILAVVNREIASMTLEFSGIYREVFSPAGQQWTNTGAEIFAATNYNNLRGSADLNSLRIVPRQVTKNAPTNGFATNSVVFDVEAPTGELVGKTLTLLPVDPNYVSPSVNTTPPLITEPPDALITGDDTNGVEIYRYDLATWSARNTGLSGSSLTVNGVSVVPYWWIRQNSIDYEDTLVYIATDGGVYHSQDFGKSWLNRTPLAALDSAPAGVTPNTVSYIGVDVYSATNDIGRVIALIARELVTGTYHSWVLLSLNAGFNWTSLKQEGGSSEEHRIISVAVGQGSGTTIYETYQDIPNTTLYLRALDQTLAQVGSLESFGTATEAEVDGGTYALEVATFNDPSLTDTENFVVVYGRMPRTS